jgi:hypothetical protein
MPNVNHTIGPNGRTLPISATNPLPVEAIASPGTVSSGNTTTALLGAGATFTGVGEDILNFATLTISIHSDVVSAAQGLKIQFSLDNTEWHTTDEYTYENNGIFKTYSLQRVARYFRLIYTNGPDPQTHMELSVIFNPVAGVASSHRIGDTIKNEDDAQLMKSVLSGQAPIGDQINIVATAAGALKTDVVTPVGNLPVSQLSTLMDGKTLNREFNELWEQVGTGTHTFQTNKLQMSVGVGEWCVYQTRRFYPYFSGKPQKIELTFDNFHPETNVTKRVGYFSSNTASPFDATYDGFYLESSGNTIRFVLENAGATVFDVDIADWDGFDIMNGYEDPAHWENFTVIEFNFLWLGGAYIEIRLVTPEGFTTVHSEIYAGTSTDVFIQSPNQPARYEIRSTTGTGNFRAICSQIATSGSINESAYSKSVNTGHLPINLVTVGTTYPLLAIRKTAALRANPIRITNADCLLASADTIRWSIQINPTLSAALTYAAVTGTAFDSAVGDGAITVTGDGIIIASGYLVQADSIQAALFRDNYLSWLSGAIDGVQDEYILCITPVTNNVNVHGALSVFEG